MHLSASALIALSAAFAASSSQAAVLNRRLGADCQPYKTGNLAVHYTENVPTALNGQVLAYAGVDKSVKHTGIDGAQVSRASTAPHLGLVSQSHDFSPFQDSILITRNSDGSALSPQKWEFVGCSSITSWNGENAGTTVSGSNNITTYFGVVRPQGATKHCLALESTDANAAERSVLDSYCDQIGDQERIWTYKSNTYGRIPFKNQLYFDDRAVIVSNTAHKELQFFEPGKLPSDQYRTQVGLVLV